MIIDSFPHELMQHAFSLSRKLSLTNFAFEWLFLLINWFNMLTCLTLESVKKSLYHKWPAEKATIKTTPLFFFFGVDCKSSVLWCFYFFFRFCRQHQIYFQEFHQLSLMYEVEFPSLANKNRRHKKRKEKKKLKYFLRSGSFFTLFSCFVFP